MLSVEEANICMTCAARTQTEYPHQHYTVLGVSRRNLEIELFWTGMHATCITTS